MFSRQSVYSGNPHPAVYRWSLRIVPVWKGRIKSTITIQQASSRICHLPARKRSQPGKDPKATRNDSTIRIGRKNRYAGQHVEPGSTTTIQQLSATPPKHLS
ncbi:hypothetical protein Plim_0819 [Planctopirus limnophila DSM 3776]|uniref:Uncharacterized protein n=1 Tax=Planctopirus limnophila (strain ATCC 43296 / DSM 3776 / IFAM 1008 / Mu 290) TaxID=521674 RepID=D5SSB6_PLAL2|nr:hypothetical protein Plim_0819 [Planctopirus limnophila DSM 3776]